MLCALLTATPLDAATSNPDGAASDPIEVFGRFRIRGEALDGQFRRGVAGGDQALVFRTLLHTRATFGAVTFGLELQDSRSYLDDSGTPLSTSIVNPLDVLQAYVNLRSGDDEVRLGRITLDVGSRRWVERNGFRNTINTYTGAHWIANLRSGSTLHTFLVAPVRLEPFERAGRDANSLQADRADFNRRFAAVHYIRPRGPRHSLDLFIYGLHEDDRRDRPTANRRYLFPGVRLYARPEPRAFDYDLEYTYRWGQRRATSAPDDRVDLDVRAYSIHAEWGYSFGAEGRLRLALDYDEATGDDDPNDGTYERWDRLFGTRRRDLGHTGIFGALTRANLRAPGLHFEVTASPRLDARIAYKSAYLASPTDDWQVAGLRDPSGRSGRMIGRQLEGRTRYWLVPGLLRGEIGLSALFAGEFAERAPGARGQDTLFGYFQLTTEF